MKPDDPSALDASNRPNWEEHPFEWPRSIGKVDLLMAALHTREQRQRRRRVAAAACAVAALGLVVASSLPRAPAIRPATPAVVASMPGMQFVVRRPEQRVLPDGSRVEFKAGAEISVDFGPDGPGLRRVVLLRGEAHFQVSKDPTRPFVVEAGGVEFRAVGTAFSVALATDAVKMLVTEGQVAVQRDRTPDLPAPAEDHTAGPASVLVGMGERVVVDVAKAATGSTPEVMPTTTNEMAELLAWRNTHFEFNEMKLSQVVELLREHSTQRIQLGSAALGSLEISGVLRADNVEPLLQVLEANYPIEALRHTDGTITLRAVR